MHSYQWQHDIFDLISVRTKNWIFTNNVNEVHFFSRQSRNKSSVQNNAETNLKNSRKFSKEDGTRLSRSESDLNCYHVEKNGNDTLKRLDTV